jgi:hypothetical protein
VANFHFSFPLCKPRDPGQGEDVLWGRLLLLLIYAPRLGNTGASGEKSGTNPSSLVALVLRSTNSSPHSWYIFHHMEAARLALYLLPSRNTGCEGVGGPWPIVNMRLRRLRWGLSLQPPVAVPTRWGRPPTFKPPSTLWIVMILSTPFLN